MVELQEALSRFLLTPRAESTRNTYRRILTRFVEDIGPQRALDSIRPDDLDAYVLTLRRQHTRYQTHPSRPVESGSLSPATIYKRLKTIKRFFNWCVGRELLDISPARFIVNHRPAMSLADGKAATVEEVRALVAATQTEVRNHAIVWLLAQSGVRASEVASLQIRNLDLTACRAVVTGKGDKRRTIYYHIETADAIRAWLAIRPQANHDRVFLNEYTGDPISGAAVSQMVRRLCGRAGLERGLGAHALRHYVGTTLARGHLPIPIIQTWLGHSDAQITIQYTRSLDDRDVNAAARLLSPDQ